MKPIRGPNRLAESHGALQPGKGLALLPRRACLTLALGGHKVPVNDFADGTPCIRLDWFIHTYIVIVGFQAVFNHANVSVRLGPLRYLIVTPDFHHRHHSQDTEGIHRNDAAHFACIDHLFGTAHKTDRPWPERDGVVVDCVPSGFFRQLVFPFTRQPR